MTRVVDDIASHLRTVVGTTRISLPVKLIRGRKKVTLSTQRDMIRKQSVVKLVLKLYLALRRRMEHGQLVSDIAPSKIACDR